MKFQLNFELFILKLIRNRIKLTRNSHSKIKLSVAIEGFTTDSEAGRAPVPVEGCSTA